jgi:hypothetical protein
MIYAATNLFCSWKKKIKTQLLIFPHSWRCTWKATWILWGKSAQSFWLDMTAINLSWKTLFCSILYHFCTRFSWKWNFRATCLWTSTSSSLSCCLAILSPCGICWTGVSGFRTFTDGVLWFVWALGSLWLWWHQVCHFPILSLNPPFSQMSCFLPFPTLHYVKIYVNFSLYGWKPFQNLLPRAVISLELVLLVCRSVGNCSSHFRRCSASKKLPVVN